MFYIIILEVVIMDESMLRNSLQDHKIVTIIYQRGKEITQRDIRIMKLMDKDVEAYCYLRNQVRHFKKENILAITYKQ
jgi:predicted DNA-binding transcriptional regulator YafY